MWIDCLVVFSPALPFHCDTYLRCALHSPASFEALIRGSDSRLDRSHSHCCGTHLQFFFLYIFCHTSQDVYDWVHESMYVCVSVRVFSLSSFCPTDYEARGLWMNWIYCSSPLKRFIWSTLFICLFVPSHFICLLVITCFACALTVVLCCARVCLWSRFEHSQDTRVCRARLTIGAKKGTEDGEGEGTSANGREGQWYLSMYTSFIHTERRVICIAHIEWLQQERTQCHTLAYTRTHGSART